MAAEIERKFLVKNSDYVGMAESSVRICQGYLTRRPEGSVRVRIKGDRGYLTVKGITRGAVREEYEYEVPLADAEGMLSLCEGRIIEKRRYFVPFEGMTWEVDEFSTGLVLAEVELPSADASVALPPFVGEEVTGRPEYYNSNL